MRVKYPASTIRWHPVESSNVDAVGWDRSAGMYVRFKGGTVYRYAGVSRQRAVACAHYQDVYGRSVGHYVNLRVKPRFPCTKIGG